MAKEANTRNTKSLLPQITPHKGEKSNVTAFITEDQRRLSYSMLRSSIEGIIADLKGFGLHKHMRVVTISKNGTTNSLLILATMEAAICCPLSPNLTQHELSEQLSALDADLVICADLYHDRVAVVCNELQLPCLSFSACQEPWQVVFSWQKEIVRTANEFLIRTPNAKNSAEYSLILLTSGSTGRPKRVGLSIENLMHSAREVAKSLQLDDSDICLSMWEQYHIGGVVDLLLAPLVAGSTVLMTSGFSAQNFRTAITSWQFSWLQCVPTTLLEMLHVMKTENLAVPDSLRLIRSVASNLSPELQQEAEQLFGVSVLQTYGMTEASPLITSNLLPKKLHKIGTVGKPLSTQIKVIRRGLPVSAAGEVGEIMIRGLNVISSYDDPTGETASCFKDGWFRTGDLGYFDDEGFLCLNGREKQQINRGGEKISPKELEICCTSHEGVEDAIAIGLPHPTLGSVPGLIVASREKPSAAMKASLQNHLLKNLSPYKQPVSTWWVDRLPKTVTGKLLHSELQLLLERLQAHQLETSPSSDTDRSATSEPSFIERRLRDIWAHELARDQVDLYQDFVALGGDSLSSVRVLMAAERQFGIRYPSDRWEEMTTVAAMALCTEELLRKTLAQHNRSLGDQEQPSTTIMRGIDAKSQLEFTISTGISGEVCVDEFNDEELAAYLIKQQSVIQAKAAIERRRNLWTPQEMLNFTGLYEACCSSEQATLDKDQGQILTYLNAIRNALVPTLSASWQATPICQGVHFYHAQHANEAKAIKARDKILIVGFGGYFNRMMMAMDTWLSQLDGSRYDFLFVWDESRCFYNSGVDGLGQSPEEMSKQLERVIASLGHNQVIGIGVSMGAYPCAAISRSLYWKGALVICPDLGEKHPKYQQILRGSTHNGPIQIYCGADNEADVVAGKQLVKEHHIQLKLVKGCSGHNLLWFLYQRGALPRFLKRSVDLLAEGRGPVEREV